MAPAPRITLSDLPPTAQAIASATTDAIAAAQAGDATAFDDACDRFLLTDPEYPRVVPGDADAALTRLLAIVAEAVAAGTWTRLKACREPSCRWAYYDYSRNRRRTWCSMDICGNRAKARASHHRKATARP